MDIPEDVKDEAAKSRTEGLMFQFPARIITRALAGNLLELAKSSRALDPAIFDEFPPFFWTSEISNQQLDSYYTRMDPTSLENYAKDCNAGIAFQDSHDTYRMSLGRSLTGAVEEASGIKRTVADFYTIAGIKFNGGSYATSDDYIRSVRSGIAKDNSIGFYFENTDPNVFAGFRCDICGGDLMSWSECPHIPGFTYELTKEGGEIQRVIATATILNAHASECSIVYDGATPGAGIIKAQQGAEIGRLRPEAARFLEQRYRSIGLRFPDVKTIFALGTTREEEMPPEETKPEVKPEARAGAEVVRHPDDVAFQNAIRAALTKAGFAETQDVTEAVTAMTDELRTLRAERAEIPALKAKAKDGEAYRTHLIDHAIKEGIRAHGKDWNAEGYRKTLEALSLDEVKRMGEDWSAIGDKLFPGGRKTEDGTEETPAPARQTPAFAHTS